MYKNKKILAIIPARGGSKGIKLKNLKKINNKSLVQLACEEIKKIKYIDYSMISTDNLKIAKEALKFNVNFPFLRPNYLSGDLISDFQIIEYNLRKIEKINKVKFDVILLIQPTSPLRKSTHIIKGLKKLIDLNLDSVWSISKVNLKFHPLKQLKYNSKIDRLSLFDIKGKKIIARQQLENTFYRNGIFYAISRKCILEQKTILGKKSSGIIIHGNHISIDTISDLEQVKKQIANK